MQENREASEESESALVPMREPNNGRPGRPAEVLEGRADTNENRNLAPPRWTDEFPLSNYLTSLHPPDMICGSKPRFGLGFIGRQLMNESVRHSSELKSTEHIVSGSFEFGGNKLSLIGTSGLPKKQSRLAEGKPVRSAPSAREQSPHEASELMEFGGNKLQVLGTSGPPKERSRMAEGAPIRREFVAKTGRMNEGAVMDSHDNAGQLVRENPESHFPNVGSTGSGHLTGGPVRRA